MSVYSRIHRLEMQRLLVPAEATLQYFRHGQAIGWSGFTPVNYPKVVPLALAKHVEANNLQGKMQFDLFVGASVGPEVEDRWANNNMIRTRWPFQSSKPLTKLINEAKVKMGDIHLSNFAYSLTNGAFNVHGHDDVNTDPGFRRLADQRGHLDIAVIEASEILADGSIVPGGAVGIIPEIVDLADKIIIEVNTSIPSFRGWHDMIPEKSPPYRKPFLITRPDDHIGQDAMAIDPAKVVAIVESKMPDHGMPSFVDAAPQDTAAIAQHIVDFIQEEVHSGRLHSRLLPLQSGIGNICNAVVGGLIKAPFHDVQYWGEVIQDALLDYIDSGKLVFASAVSLSLTQKGFERLYSKFNFYRDRIVLRPQQIANAPEIIRRLGVICMNTAVEADIYGHVNSTLVNGSRMLNGIGGSGDFLRNSYISIVHMPSVRKTANGWISSIVPMCSHVDHTEHDIGVIVTEQGLADLRGLTPRDRAREVIKVAHPMFRPQLLAYLEESERACLKQGAMHEPHMLSKVFKMHTNMQENGTMLLKSWE